MTYRDYRITALAIACMAVACGCNSAAAPASASDTEPHVDAKELPAVHAVLQWEMLDKGRNIHRENYFRIVKVCKEAGFATKELSAQEIQKLGIGKVELWKDSHGEFSRETSWELDIEDPSAEANPRSCLLKMKETVEAGGHDDRDADWSQVDIPSVAEQDAMARLGGFARVGTATVKGQPCTRWRNKDLEVCSWSGGGRLGIVDGPAKDECSAGSSAVLAYMNPLPLEIKGYRDRSSCNLELKSMMVSRGFLKEVDQYLRTEEVRK